MEDQIVETEIEAPAEEKAGRYVAGGPTGELSAKSMLDRARKVDNTQRRVDYRTCINCEWCTGSIELRSFHTDGETIDKTLYCTVTSTEVDCYHTCNYAHRNKRGRRKVIWDLKNAPLGFGDRLTPTDTVLHPGRKNMNPDRTADLHGEYRGGSSYYKRADGDEKAKGTKQMPRGLGN